MSTGAGSKSVLVVEDDVVFARTLERILSHAGFDVTWAEDGSVAAEKIMTAAYDVILSDIQMPKMSGVELLSVVRAYDLDVPVILMTGDPKLETAIEAVSLGALQYLIKPAPNEVLVEAVERASRLHQMARMKREALQLVSEGGTEAGDRAGLVTRFEHALETLWMAYQPIVDVPRRQVYAYEALLRSDEPSLPTPGAVLGAAERLDRLHDVGRRARARAAEAFARAPSGALLFINLHARDLMDPELYEAEAPLTKIADRVVLEITERAAIENVEGIKARVSVLRYHGFRIAIDDLGAGYAGLSSFVALEPEIVKLDMSLVRNAHTSEIKQRLIGSMTSLCKEMGMRVVAEGVEAIAEYNTLRGFGCDLVQGHYFAKPGPPFPQARFPPR